MVAKEKISAAMERIGPAASHHIHRADAGNACGKIKIGARQLEFLHNFLREIHTASAFDGVANVPAVNSDGRLAGIAA